MEAKIFLHTAHHKNKKRKTKQKQQAEKIKP